MDIIYEREKEENEINLFGSKFVENNKNCFILIDNRIRKIAEQYKTRDKKIKIKLFTDKIVNDMSYMFFECKSLLHLPDISNWNTNKVKNIFHMFYGCKSLLSLPGISKWNTISATGINELFSNTKDLSQLYNNNNVFKKKTIKKTIKKNSILSKNKKPSFILSSTFHLSEKNNNIKSICFFISKDLIICMTNSIYDYINGYAKKIIIQDLNIEINLKQNDNIIIENKNTKNQLSIIKLINKEIILDNYYEIESEIKYSSEEKFFNR